MSSEPPSTKPRGFFDRITAAFHDDELTDREDLTRVLREARQRNLLAPDTYSMMEGALKVAELRASDLMVPRAQVLAVDLAEPPSAWIRMAIESGHSRFPAVEGDLDNVLGIVHAKDLLRLSLNPTLDVKTLLRQPREISDEFDHEDKAGNILPEGSGWRVKALTPIDQFNEFFASDLDDPYCETIGGLVTDRFEHVPRAGEEIVEKGFRFKILSADERQALLLSVERI